MVLCSSVAPDSASAAKPSRAARKKAIQLFKASQDAYRNGLFRQAAELLDQAYALDPNPTLLFNKARALESAGELDETVEAYRQYLEADPRAADRAAIERRMENLNRQIEAQRELERTAEEERKRREQLEAAPPPPVPPPPEPPAAEPRVVQPPPPAAPSEPSRVTPWPWTVLGAGVVGIAAGGIVGAMAKSTHATAVDEPIQQTAETLRDRAERFALGANIAYGVGGALAAAGLIWGVVELTRPRRAQPAVTVSPTGATVSF